jgi:predicted Zn finger-like uncharacterized protein
MSLATRCPACGTVFRVVQDQLRVSEGWVRCGRCEDVFNALEGLFDLEHDAPPTWGGGESAPVPMRPAAAPPPPPPQPPPAPDQPFVAEVAADEAPEHQATLVMESRPPARGDTPARESDHDQFDVPLPPPTMTEVPAVDPAAVGFLHRAERSARWQQPGVRAALVASATVLGLLLAAQVARERREDLVARWPQSLPLLAALCEATGCRIGAPQRIERLTVDASGLVRLDGPGNIYRVSLTLRNHDAVGLALPQVELTLTDTQGEVSARRVLRARELGARSPVIAGGGELGLHALLDGGDARWAGYSIEIFYP